MAIVKQEKQRTWVKLSVRVEEELALELESYGRFAGCPPERVVNESLRYVFERDREYRSWRRANHPRGGDGDGDGTAAESAGAPPAGEPAGKAAPAMAGLPQRPDPARR